MMGQKTNLLWLETSRYKAMAGTQSKAEPVSPQLARRLWDKPTDRSQKLWGKKKKIQAIRRHRVELAASQKPLV